MMFSDALVGNGAGHRARRPSIPWESFPIVGGSSGDDFKFEKTTSYLNDKALFRCSRRLGT